MGEEVGGGHGDLHAGLVESGLEVALDALAPRTRRYRAGSGRCRGSRPRRRPARPACGRCRRASGPGRVSTPKGSLPLCPTVHRPKVNLSCGRGREVGQLLSPLAISWGKQQTAQMPAASQLVAGVDCSTQATKVLVVDPADGAVVADRPRPARGHRHRRRARDRSRKLVGGAAPGACRDRAGGRAGRALGGRPAARARGERGGRPAAAAGGAVERHALRARRGATSRSAGRGALGRERGRGARALLHGHPLGLAAAHRARAGRARDGRFACPTTG